MANDGQKIRRFNMSRLTVPALDEVPAESKATLSKINEMLGFVPNLQRLMSRSPNVLNGWFNLMGSLGKTLDVKTRDGIALATSEVNGCNYCLAAHSYISTNMAKLPPEEIEMLREGKSMDPKRGAAAKFAQQLIKKRGKVSDADIAEAKLAGWTEENLIEIAASSMQYLFTNFMNNLADTDIDFPKVKPTEDEYAYRDEAHPYGEGISCGVGG
jgi:uncharacterized peroxidase-related enzyme